MSAQKQKGQEMNGKALVLRTCREDMTSARNFKWPESGPVECPDWEPSEECGNGFHGWLYGQGDHSASSYLDASAKWLVVEVELSEVIMLGGKCKFPKGVVRFTGNKKDATDYLLANEPRAQGVAVIGATLTVGDEQAVTVGALGTATAGYSGTATAGYRGTATAGDSGEIRIRYWDDKAERYRTKVGYIGEDGLEAGKPYRLNDRHEFVEAQ